MLTAVVYSLPPAAIRLCTRARVSSAKCPIHAASRHCGVLLLHSAWHCSQEAVVHTPLQSEMPLEKQHAGNTSPQSVQ